MIALNVCPVCKFILTGNNMTKQEVIGDSIYTTNILCSCGAVLKNELLVVSMPERKPIRNVREEK